MCDESNEERQDNEFDVLKAIFDNEVEDNRGSHQAWKVWRPLNLFLSLKPSPNTDTKEIHCSITLHFKCCFDYPKKPPAVAIHKMHGLSTESGKQLLKQLEESAKALCGEVMIYELAQHAKQFLDDHNKPTLSFYEQMLLEKYEIEKLKLDDLKAKEEEERRKIRDEIQQRHEMLKGTAKLSALKTNISQDNDSVDGVCDTPELLYYADNQLTRKLKRSKTQELPCTCKSKPLQQLIVAQWNNKKVYIGNCLGHSSTGVTSYLALGDRGEIMVTKKWTLPRDPALFNYHPQDRNLSAIERDIKVMRRLNQPSLVPYVAMDSITEISKRNANLCIYLFRDFVQGNSLSSLIDKMNIYGNQSEQLQLLRHVATGVLTALDSLHSAGLLHKDVRGENVFLDNTGNVKLVGATVDSQLLEFWETNSNFYKHTAAEDIIAMGQLLLSIVSRDGNYAIIPQELPCVAKDFISRCMTEDEHSESSAKILVKHRFLVDSLARQPKDKDAAESSGSEDEETIKKIQSSSAFVNPVSRLNAEFEMLAWLGRGAFGDVLKVKNKLDGLIYAIKRINLDPKKVEINKKIIREVKLLSRLTHENVVRYYTAWIESTDEAHDVTDDSSIGTISPVVRRHGDSLKAVVAKLGPGAKVGWSMSDGPIQKINSSCDSEDDEDDDDDDDDDDEQEQWFDNISPEEDTNSGIEFERNSADESHSIPSDAVTGTETDTPPNQKYHVLYIQMEFCKKRTLRQAIDGELHLAQFRVWRLFREIVEGLGHVHQRGMIHRDLKPDNIFLDSSDHVKIGDFGLATKTFTVLPSDDKLKHSDVGGSLTGQIGTSFYKAPELRDAATKVLYNQKVDIYSLGIILFEMLHPPFATEMERRTALSKLSSKDVQMPPEFEVEENAKIIRAIRWLLNHDPSVRPTCAELLSSEHIPRPVHESVCSGWLSHMLSDRSAWGYKRLVAACLDHHLSPAEDYTYHNEMKPKPMEILAAIKDSVISVFRSHGATEFAPPLMTPRAKCWDQHPNAVKVMTASGYVCHLPHDLRLPFARHTAHAGVKYMRRYVIDRIYREKHVPGFHPREIIECAFDIVTPKIDSLWSDAELLVVAYRAASKCSLKVCIQLNHTELIGILLQSCGVSTEKHASIYPVLVDVSIGRITRLQLQTHLTSLCITSRDVSNLLRLMEADVPVQEVRELVAPLSKQPKWTCSISQAIQELETVCNTAIALGCECPITVAPFLAYNATKHSGVFWQMSVERNAEQKQKAKHRWSNLIAAGGRYDTLVEEFCKIVQTEQDQDGIERKTSSVGFSMSLEKMAAILKKTDTDLPPLVKNIETLVTYVCVSDTSGTGAERAAKLARDLWVNGHFACTWAAQPAEAQDLHRAGILALQDGAFVRLSSWDSTRSVKEQKVHPTEVVDVIKQYGHADPVRTPEGSGASRSLSWSESEKHNCPNTSITFITSSQMFTKKSKRHHENQINKQITSILAGLRVQTSRIRIHVLAMECHSNCVKLLAAHLSAPVQLNDLSQAFKAVSNTYPKLHKLLDEASEALHHILQSYQNKTNEETQLYALFSLPDSLCKLIT